MTGVEAQVSETRVRGRLGAEVLIVLGLSLGQSAVYAVVSLVAKLTRGPLSQQTATLNAPQSPRPYLDLTYQLLSLSFALVPVVLALFLLSEPGRSALRRIGFDVMRPARDLASGAGLAALIGIPGLGLYFAGRALGLTATVVPSALDAYWWTVPVLLLSALKNAVLEEVVAVGYLVERTEQMGWSVPVIVAASAALRGGYHLYQGFGPFIGNVLMGVLFAVFYLRTRRVAPLVVAHTLLDVVAFVGYDLFADELGLA
jgi:membrane protease YdiL (CAAX protease family)